VAMRCSRLLRTSLMVASLAALASLAPVCVPAAAASAGAPVIHEPFTPLPCPSSPQTTLAIEGCDEKAILASDRSIDRDAARIYALLGREARPSFVQAEASWLRYRESSCSAEASKAQGGTLAPVLAAQCDVDLDQTHLGDLRGMAQVLSRP